MSEYSITVRASRWQLRLKRSFIALCGLSIWLWPTVVAWQWAVQWPLTLVMLWLIIRQGLDAQAQYHLQLDESGKVQLKQAQLFNAFEISPQSVTSEWFCYLILVPQGIMSTGPCQRLWLFADALDEASFRRLCKVVHRVKRQ